MLWIGVTIGGTGCGHIDVTPEGSPDRVLTGTLNFLTALPAGTEIQLRVIDPTPSAVGPVRMQQDLPLATRPEPMVTERVLAEERIELEALAPDPVPFRIAYRAEDYILRYGLNLDVRVSYGGRVRYRTLNAHVITLASSAYRQEVWLQPVQ